MTRAQNDLMLVAPLKFHVTNQPRLADGHVYGGRSRFLSEKLIKCFDAVTFHGTRLAEVSLGEADSADLDVSTKLKEMW